MRRILIYSLCGLLTFILGVAATVTWFMYDREEVVLEPAHVSAPLAEKSPATVEDALADVSFQHVGAERELMASGKCVSVQKYLSSDGVEILYQVESFKSVARAQEAFRKSLAGEIKVVRLKSIMNDRNLKLGESAITLHPSESGAGLPSVLTWIGKEVLRHTSPSQKHLLFFIDSYKPDILIDACR